MYKNKFGWKVGPNTFRRAFRTVELPAELKGKSADEVAAYYQNLVQVQKSTYESALEAMGNGNDGDGGNGNSNEPSPPKITMSDFLADPSGKTKDMITQFSVSREEFTQASKAVQESMIYMARERAQKELQKEAGTRGDSYDWDRMETPLIEISKKCDPASLTNPETWKTMYYYNRGQLTGTLVKDAVTKATMPMEQVVPGGNEPAPKTPLTAEQKTVAEGMGLTEDTYRESAHRMKTQQFPVTVDNRGRR